MLPFCRGRALFARCTLQPYATAAQRAASSAAHYTLAGAPLLRLQLDLLPFGVKCTPLARPRRARAAYVVQYTTLKIKQQSKRARLRLCYMVQSRARDCLCMFRNVQHTVTRLHLRFSVQVQRELFVLCEANYLASTPRIICASHPELFRVARANYLVCAC